MTDGPGWSATRIALVLYPFGAGALAVNIFMASLFGTYIGWPALSGGWSVALGCVAGVPATWAFARHIRALMDAADGDGQTRHDQ